MKRLDVENLEGDIISYLIGEKESFFYLSPALKLRKLCLCIDAITLLFLRKVCMHAIHLSNLRCSEVLMMEKEFAQRRCIYKWLLKICLTGFSELEVFLKFYAVHILGRGLCDISVRECHTHWVAPGLMDWLTAYRAQPGNWVVVQLN